MSSESGITYKVAWQKNDEKIANDACNIWKEMGAIKEASQGMQRAKLLSVVAHNSFGKREDGISKEAAQKVNRYVRSKLKTYI